MVGILHGSQLPCEENPLSSQSQKPQGWPRPPPLASGVATPTSLPRSLGMTSAVSHQNPYSTEGTHSPSSSLR